MITSTNRKSSTDEKMTRFASNLCGKYSAANMERCHFWPVIVIRRFVVKMYFTVWNSRIWRARTKSGVGLYIQLMFLLCEENQINFNCPFINTCWYVLKYCANSVLKFVWSSWHWDIFAIRSAHDLSVGLLNYSNGRWICGIKSNWVGKLVGKSEGLKFELANETFENQREE